MIKLQKQKGYIALTALLIVAAAGLTIGIAVSLGGIEQVQLSYGQSRAAEAKALANTCLEEGLERLRNNWANYSSSLSIDGSSCILNTVTSGSGATLTATGKADIYNQKIEIQVDNNLTVISWKEE
ncbi:MAG: hypothetical protein WCX08_03930 [Candidatus Buchananbacteria bacterium]|jgi:hypothetical protein